MSFSVVVLSFNALTDIERCIDSLVSVEKLKAPADQIIVVDNGSNDGSRGVVLDLEHRYPGLVEGIYLCANHGTTIARNLAFLHARGDVLLVLDSDVFFEHPVLAPLHQCLMDDPTVGLIVPRLVCPDGRPQRSTNAFPTLWQPLERLIRPRSSGQQPIDAIDALRAVDYAWSAFWLMRRDLLDKVGPLDEHIFHAPEDVDYCLRIWLAGYRIVEATAHSVVHDRQRRTRGWETLRARWDRIQGYSRVFTKHGYVIHRRQLYRRMPLHPRCTRESSPVATRSLPEHR